MHFSEPPSFDPFTRWCLRMVTALLLALVALGPTLPDAAVDVAVAEAGAPPAPPAAPPRPPAPPRSAPLTAEELIELHFGPESARALRVAECESGVRSVRSEVANSDGTHDWGVFQFNDGGTLAEYGGTPRLALDPAWNVEAAKRLFDDRGWQPWTCGRKLGYVR